MRYSAKQRRRGDVVTVAAARSLGTCSVPESSAVSELLLTTAIGAGDHYGEGPE